MSKIAQESNDYTECYVAFLDILGFKDMVERSKTDAGVLTDLIRVLNTTATITPTKHTITDNDNRCDANKYAGERQIRSWETQIRSFSDSVTLFIPTETDALADILYKVRYLHDRLLELDCCLRGAVTIGKMYWNDNWSCLEETRQLKNDKPEKIVQKEIIWDRDTSSDAFITLGPALVEAHELETTVAIYPRVIISPCLMEYIDKKAKSIPEKATQGIHKAAHVRFLCLPSTGNRARCILDFIRTDFDGIPFLDMFHRDIDRNDTKRIVRELPDGKMKWIRDDMTFEKFMRSTRTTIERFLKEKKTEKVRVKYLWLANYFNSSLKQYNIDPLPVSWAHEKYEKSPT
mgnify:CR=1 FL=1